MLTTIGVVAALFCAWVTFANAYKQSEKGQQWSESLKEAWTNIAIGFSINYALNLIVLPLVGAELGSELTYWNNFMIGWIYTAVSFIRQVVIRRYYNWRMVRVAR